MNANELADELDEAVMKLVANNHFFEAQAVEKAQTMLRQQQAENEALKAVLEQEGTGVGRDLLNGGIALFRKASER